MIKVNGHTAGIKFVTNVKRRYLGQLIERVTGTSSNITESVHDSNYTKEGAFSGTSPTDLRNPQAGTCWSAERNNEHAWIAYSFEGQRWFNKIEIKCFSNYSGAWQGHIKVQGSSDGITWENLIPSGESVEIVAKYQEMTTVEIPLLNNKMYNTIRIYVMEMFTVYYQPSIFIDEIFVYGGDEYAGGGGEIYTIEQGSTFTAEDATSVNTENGKLYMFLTGNHSGSFANANLIVGDAIYFEILDGIGVAAAIIQATSNTVTYDGAWSGGYSLTEIDVLKNGVEDLSIDCFDKSNSWVSGTSISANVGDYFLIADTVDNDSGTVIGADVLIEETLTQSPTALNIKIRIIKATATTISLSSGNSVYYRKFGLRKEI